MQTKSKTLNIGEPEKHGCTGTDGISKCYYSARYMENLNIMKGE